MPINRPDSGKQGQKADSVDLNILAPVSQDVATAAADTAAGSYSQVSGKNGQTAKEELPLSMPVQTPEAKVDEFGEDEQNLPHRSLPPPDPKEPRSHPKTL